MALIPTRQVIIVPGFTGSALTEHSSWAGDFLVWMHPFTLATGGFNRMYLPVPGEAPPKRGITELNGGPPLMSYYGGMYRYLEAKGWDMEVPTGDWRQPLMFDANNLVSRIRDATSITQGSKTSTNIVCHSRGGLVVRAALKILADAGELSRIGRVIGIAVPHRGSLNAVQTLAGWSPFVAQLGRLLINTTSVVSWLVKSSYTDQTVLQGVLRSWPAVYELMPDPDRAPPDIAGAAVGFYQADRWSGQGLPPNPTLLSGAAANWRSLPDPDPSVEWIDFAGNGFPTAFSCTSARAGIEVDGQGITQAGDGTVTFDSATVSGRKNVVFPDDHSMLIIDNRVWTMIDRVLTNGLSSNLVIDGRSLAVPA